MAISSLAQGQDGKIHLRDFTPKYTIDTFQIKGDADHLKIRGITIQQAEAVKSAYWDADTKILTVQYNRKLVKLSAIKNFFFNNESLSINANNQKRGKMTAFDCCTLNTHSLTSKNKK